MTKLSWAPVLRGYIYCASACGRGCTVAEYERARKSAEALAKKLGPGWQPRVHENLGWHASVNFRGLMAADGHRHLLEVSDQTIYLNTDPQFVGDFDPQRPRASVRKQLQKAAAFAEVLITLVKQADL